ncbi:hypothetical protein JCM19000A_08130 [Silvimonas sp. JCM 19000]
MITPTNPVALLDLALYPNPFIVLAMIRPNLCSSLKNTLDKTAACQSEGLSDKQYACLVTKGFPAVLILTKQTFLRGKQSEIPEGTPGTCISGPGVSATLRNYIL